MSKRALKKELIWKVINRKVFHEALKRRLSASTIREAGFGAEGRLEHSGLGC